MTHYCLKWPILAGSYIPTSRNDFVLLISSALNPRFYRLRVAPLVDVGLLLCSLVCIDQARELFAMAIVEKHNGLTYSDIQYTRCALL